jgi:hypothetical protein
MKLPEFNLFSDKSAQIFLIFPSICPNFHSFQKKIGGGAVALPVSYTYGYIITIGPLSGIEPAIPVQHPN